MRRRRTATGSTAACGGHCPCLPGSDAGGSSPAGQCAHQLLTGSPAWCHHRSARPTHPGRQQAHEPGRNNAAPAGRPGPRTVRTAQYAPLGPGACTCDEAAGAGQWPTARAKQHSRHEGMRKVEHAAEHVTVAADGFMHTIERTVQAVHGRQAEHVAVNAPFCNRNARAAETRRLTGDMTRRPKCTSSERPKKRTQCQRGQRRLKAAEKGMRGARSNPQRGGTRRGRKRTAQTAHRAGSVEREDSTTRCRTAPSMTRESHGRGNFTSNSRAAHS